jgi:hypothetical protein
MERSGEGRKAYILYAMLCTADLWCPSLRCRSISRVLPVGEMLICITRRVDERACSPQALVRRSVWTFEFTDLVLQPKDV